MNWFTGDVALAIQKAINEKKVFIVFVKDDKESSKSMESLWDDDQIAEVCCERKCVAINITADSVPGQQFGAIYPILCVPSTYLINNQGTPTDIIPGVLEKEEFLKRLTDAIDNTLSTINTQPEGIASTDDSKVEDVIDSEQPDTTSTSETNASNDTSTTDVQNSDATTDAKESCSGSAPQASSETFNDDLEAELTTQEKSQIDMLREKVKQKREEEEKEKLKEMEKKRIQAGRELQMAQRQMAEKQAIQLAKEIADRKAEEKAAREKVREQIRQDRLEKTKRFDKEKKEREEELRKKKEASAAPQTEKKKVDSTTARLQFRLPDGSSVSNTFNAEAKFLVAEAFVKEHVQLPNIRLTTVFPKHEFDSQDALKSFRELGLVPNACIIVSPGRSSNSSKLSTTASSLNPISFLMFVLAPIIAIFNWVLSLFSGNNNNNNNSNENQSNQSATPTYPSPSSSRDDPVRRRNVQNDSTTRSNIQRLRRDEDDENATWNGNSTQQM